MVTILLTLSLLSAGLRCENYLTWEEDPDPGPSLASVYVPGSPGSAWTGAEIESTRARILQAMDPDWEIQYNMYGRGNWGVHGKQVTENKMLRLAFHDCVRYTDGTGGCDGCLNWRGVGAETPSIFDHSDNYKYDPVNQTDNNGLEDVVEQLELIYTTIDWPLREASLTGSLQQLGKSRADLWQFAGLVALEKALGKSSE